MALLFHRVQLKICTVRPSDFRTLPVCRRHDLWQASRIGSRIRSAAATLRCPGRTRLLRRCPTRVCSRRGLRSAQTTQLKPATLDSAARDRPRTVKTATGSGSEFGFGSRAPRFERAPAGARAQSLVPSDAVRDRRDVACVSTEGLWPSPNNLTPPFRIESRLIGRFQAVFSGRFDFCRPRSCCARPPWPCCFHRVQLKTCTVAPSGSRTLPSLLAPRSLAGSRIGSRIRTPERRGPRLVPPGRQDFSGAVQQGFAADVNLATLGSRS